MRFLDHSRVRRRLSPKLYVSSPERRMLEVVAILGVVHIVHPHAQPRRDLSVTAASDPDLVRIESRLVQPLGVLWPPILGFLSIDGIPDGVTGLAAKAGPHGRAAQEQVGDRRSGILVDPRMQSLQGHVLGFARAEEMAVVFVDHQHVVEPHIARLFGDPDPAVDDSENDDDRQQAERKARQKSCGSHELLLVTKIIRVDATRCLDPDKRVVQRVPNPTQPFFPETFALSWTRVSRSLTTTAVVLLPVFVLIRHRRKCPAWRSGQRVERRGRVVETESTDLLQS